MTYNMTFCTVGMNSVFDVTECHILLLAHMEISSYKHIVNKACQRNIKGY